MTRQSTSRVALLMLALSVFTGCHPIQPFYFHEDGDLSHFRDKATQIEYPDVQTESLPDATESQEPLTVTNPEFKEMWDLTLEECVAIGLQNNKTMRTLVAVQQTGMSGFTRSGSDSVAGSATIYDPAIAETNPLIANQFVALEQAGGVEAALSAFDAQLRVTGTPLASHIDRVENRDPQFGGFFPGINNNYTGGLRSQLAKKTASGATFSIANNTEYNRWAGPFQPGTNPPHGPGLKLNSTWTTDFEVRWDQPLLQGRGTLINRIPLMLARIREDIELSQFEAQLRNFVFDLEKTYWDLHKQYRNLETAKIGRDSAQVTWKIVYEKWNEGVEPVQAEAQAREQYFNFRAAVERSLQELYNTETHLRWMMGLAATDGRLIRPIDEPTVARVGFDWTAIRTEALTRFPELRSMKWQVKAREMEVIAAKNSLLPQLDVGVLYRWFGRGDDLIYADNHGKNFASTNPAQYVGSTAFEELTGGNYQEASFFLDFRMPVGFRRELAGVRNAQLKLAREKAKLEDMELNAVHQLTTAVREVDGDYVLAQTHFNRWSAAEKEVESVNALYKGGKSTVDLVLEAQRRRAQAQVEYYNFVVEYNKAIAYVHFTKGSLLEYNNIELTEGPWPQKAYWDALQRARERDASYYFDYGWTRPSVISQGPVAGQGRVESFGDVPTEVEMLPAPQPTPADPPATPDDDPAPALPTPSADQDSVTSLPVGPMLNAPVIRTAEARLASDSASNPLRSRSPVAGSLDRNTLRGPRPEAASPVRQATYVETISDAK